MTDAKLQGIFNWFFLFAILVTLGMGCRACIAITRNMLPDCHPWSPNHSWCHQGKDSVHKKGE